MRILVVGTVSNVGAVIRGELKRVVTSLEQFADVEVFLVESDSSDNSIQELTALHEKDPRISFISFGALSQKFPSRIERIRFCRNQYVGFIRKGYKNRGWEFIVVVDLDGMNNKITERAFRSTIEASTQWSGCFANQTKGYYDLFALRCKGWVDRDIFLDLELLKVDTPFEDNYKNSFVGWINRFNHFDRLRVKAVYSKMRKISPQDSWVKVQSAFGGLGVYKPEIFLKYNYDFQNLHIEIYSEHIDLHYQCNLENLDLFINPAMINSHWNLYNLNRIKLIRFLKEFKKYLASTIWKTNFLPKSELQ